MTTGDGVTDLTNEPSNSRRLWLAAGGVAVAAVLAGVVIGSVMSPRGLGQATPSPSAAIPARRQ